MSLYDVILFLELLTVVVGTIYYKKYASSFLRYFLYWLWLVTLIEFTIWGLKQGGISFQNLYIYNMLNSIQYTYLFLLYYKTMKTPRFKKVVLGILITFLLAVIINFVWLQGVTVTASFHSYTYILGAAMLIVVISLFMVEILNSEKVLYFKRHLIFWTSVGLFLFHAGIIPFAISVNFAPALLNLKHLAGILFALNLPMYSCFIIGFIMSDKYID